MSTKTKEEHREELRRLIPKDSTVYWVCRHRSKTNMAGWYSFVVIAEDRPTSGRHGLMHPNYAIAELTGRKMTEHHGYFCIRVNGCGYDRPASVISDLAQELYGHGDALRPEGI
jgi:hypothetical protein